MLVLLALLMLSCLPKSTVPYVKFYTVPRDTFFAYGFFNGHTMCFSLCISVFYVMHNKQYTIYMKVGDSVTQLKRHNQNSFNKKFLPYGKHFEVLVNGDDIASAGKLFLF